MANKKKIMRKPKEKLKEWQNGTTGLIRRDHLEAIVKSNFRERILEISKEPEGNNDYSIIMFDVDYFKSINDLFSHEQGDLVLKKIGDVLTDYSSKKEFIGVLGRWGGEEFLISLPYSTEDRAKYIADEIRETVEKYEFKNTKQIKNTLKQQITISLGVTSVDLKKVITNSEDIEMIIKKTIQEAETAVDYAKYMGRNNVQIFGEFLMQEIKNLELIRKFYFKYASKRPKYLKDIMESDYISKNPSIKGKMLKHFNFIRTEINPKDTRMQAVLADKLYKMIDDFKNPNIKKEFLYYIKKYT